MVKPTCLDNIFFFLYKKIPVEPSHPSACAEHPGPVSPEQSIRHTQNKTQNEKKENTCQNTQTTTQVINYNL